MTKAEMLLEKYNNNPLGDIKIAMEVCYDAGVKMSAIRKETLIKQWFENDLKKIAKERAENYMKLP
jgi:hypothetical protein